MSQKYVIVHFIDKVKVPEEFPASEWPLHVTLLANFRIAKLDLLKDRLADYARQTKPLTISASGEALFGPNKNVEVSLIQPDTGIVELHNKLLSIVFKLGAVFDEPNFNGTGFRPHATIQIKSRLQDKEIVNLDSLSLVDMYPNNEISRRRIIETYKLKG
jgi:2'-5' RNA ligase